MKLFISKDYPKRFVYSYLPKFIYRKALGELNNSTIANINKYLKDVLKINYSLKDILSECIKYIYLSEFGENYIIDLGNMNRFKDTDYRTIDLLRLIEFGNIELKGTYLITKVYNFIREHCDYIYNYYYLSGR